MTVAVVAIKPFGQAKQRLRGFPRRRELAAWMAATVLNATADAREVDRVLVVTADPLAVSMARAVGAAVVTERSAGGHSTAALRGIEHALALGATRVLLLAADCPLVTSATIDRLLVATEGASVAIAPDRHGTGTNALVLAPPTVIQPAFGTDSRARHERRAALAGADCRVVHVPALAHDVDTPADLDDLATRIAEERPPRIALLRSILGDASARRPERSPSRAVEVRAPVPRAGAV